MAKYRKLTLQELQHLEKEFIDYLVVNGITADEWVKIKDEEKEKAERIIELFSDVIFENILRKARYLEYRSQNEVYAYQCLDDKIVLVGLTSGENSKVDLSDAESIKKAVKQPDSRIEIFTTEKQYNEVRETELFKMLQAGCEISNGDLFKKLCLAL